MALRVKKQISSKSLVMRVMGLLLSQKSLLGRGAAPGSGVGWEEDVTSGRRHCWPSHKSATPALILTLFNR